MAARLTITLPDHLATAVREMVETGRFTSESDVVSAGLEELIAAEDDVLEPWMEEEVRAAIAESDANPLAVYTIEEARAYLEARRNRRGRGPGLA